MKTIFKIIGVVLLLFGISGALLIPLSKGIQKVTIIERNLQAEHLEVQLLIEAYNFDFSLEKGLQFALIDPENQSFFPAQMTALQEEKQKTSFFVQAPAGTFLDLWVGDEKNEFFALYRNVLQIAEGEERVVKIDQKQDFSFENKRFSFPYREQLYETIRNLFFHVPMWFVMLFLGARSLWASLLYLRKENLEQDSIAKSAVELAVFFAVLGLLSGSIWARFTWGSWWVFQDIKLNGALLTTLIYSSYLFLRNNIAEPILRGKIAAVYNIFAFVLMYVFLIFLPRKMDSLHPGNGGNPAFSAYDLDQNLRIFFYPTVIGFILLSLWILDLKIRYTLLKQKQNHEFP